MKRKSATRMVVLISGIVILLVCIIRMAGLFWPNLDFIPRMEWITYDWRCRMAIKTQPPVYPQLGFIAIDDDSIDAIQKGEAQFISENGTNQFVNLGYKCDLYWPRHVYGRVVNELAAQQAKAVGFDVLLFGLRHDPPVKLPDGTETDPDKYLAMEIFSAGNVIVASESQRVPEQMFRENALATADVSTTREPDGILRRAKVFQDIIVWDDLIKSLNRCIMGRLDKAEIHSNQVLIPYSSTNVYTLALTNGNQFDAVRLFEELTSQKAPENEPQWKPAFTRKRCWQMGIVLAATELQLDLDKAEVDLEKGRVVLRSTNGKERIIPVDAQGRFLVDWSLTPTHDALTRESIETLLAQNSLRHNRETNNLRNLWKDKLLIVGSTAIGNDYTDQGATPLEKETCLMFMQLNVANSLLNNRFILSTPAWLECLIIAILACLAACATWKLRVAMAVGTVAGEALVYIATAAWLYIEHRYWLPIVFPTAGGLLVPHLAIIAFRVLREQQERQHINSIFGRVVSPNVRDELPHAEQLSLDGARKKITIVFADIRGFTSMTDWVQARTNDYVASHKMTPEEEQAYREHQAREVLNTVSFHLGILADAVKKFDGTLDKYIGDCVMAFWGAPTPNDKHASNCVRAMIEAQQKLHLLSQERMEENRRREEETMVRVKRGEEKLDLLPLLHFGIGINTGDANVGLMGSKNHILNYTAFGREVNIASRIEETAGPGRIYITETTYKALQKEAPDLVDICIEVESIQVKGIRDALKRYEIQWMKYTDTTAQ